jgi:hypothetical protein
MTDVDHVLARCRDLGVTLRVKGDRLLARAAKEPPYDLKQALRKHKQEIIAKLLQAEEVRWATEELLASRGWCLWRYEALGGEVIMVIDDDLASGDIPQGYVTYAYSELCCLFGPDAPPMERSTLRLVHEVKRLRGVVTGRESHANKRR